MKTDLSTIVIIMGILAIITLIGAYFILSNTNWIAVRETNHKQEAAVIHQPDGTLRIKYLGGWDGTFVTAIRIDTPTVSITIPREWIEPGAEYILSNTTTATVYGQRADTMTWHQIGYG